MMKGYVVCCYNEITLKGKNRQAFEIQLRDNLKKALSGVRHRSIFRLSGRVTVELDSTDDAEEVQRRVSQVFGIASYSQAWGSSQDLEQLESDLWSLIEGRQFESFKIQARRSPHSVPYGSIEVNKRLGAFVQRKSGKRVQLDGPDLVCHVDFVENHVFLFFERRKGAGGLPARTAGKVVSLLSGGIDSPVASYKLMKRGCRAIFVHFHSYPHTSLESQEKVRDLVRILDRYQLNSVLYLIPFADCQRRIVAMSPAASRVVLYRRLMLRLADQVAWRRKARALVTGESLGQVASQTLENLSVISQASKRPVLRPLIGDDKDEIVSVARRIGTYPVSIQPADDCCNLFVPKHPEIRAQLDRIREIEAGLDMEDSVLETIRQSKVERFD